MKTRIYVLIAAMAGLFVGWMLFGNQSENQSQDHDHQSNSDAIWTCAMHPEIRQNEPGVCPICSMDLTLLELSQGIDEAPNLVMSKEAVERAKIQTVMVSKGDISAKGKLPVDGKVMVDERRVSKLTAHFHGRIEKLYVDFIGEEVRKGQLLAEVYSPELVTAQDELLQALNLKEEEPALYQAARKKLKNWKISDSEIEKVEETGKVITHMKIHAHHGGVILKKYVNTGDHAVMGDILFEIANLKKVWVQFDVYERDLQKVNIGSNISFTIASEPERIFKAPITFIDPVIDPKTRIAKVRVELDNSIGSIKPETFTTGNISLLNSDSRELMIPVSAVLWTGKRSVVYVKRITESGSSFEFRQVTLGDKIDKHYIIKEGLKEGEEVVSRGAFTIDAASQLNGKVSMMNSN